MDFLIDHLKLCAALGRLMPKGLDMKKIYLFVVGVLVSTVAFASEPGDGSKSGLAVVKKNETTFNLFYQPVGFADVKVSILNAKGEVIFTELVKETDGFVRPYNFSDLNEGEYAIKINDGDNQLTEKLVYAKPNIKVAKVFKVGEGKYLVTIPANQVNGDAKIKIFEGTELAYSTSTTTTKDYGQVFNVKDLINPVVFEIVDSKGNKIY